MIAMYLKADNFESKLFPSRHQMIKYAASKRYPRQDLRNALKRMGQDNTQIYVFAGPARSKEVLCLYAENGWFGLVEMRDKNLEQVEKTLEMAIRRFRNVSRTGRGCRAA